jgi:glycosyltransferase involved in cell wall biosynthesis
MPLRIAGNIPDEPGAAELFEREVRPHLGAGVEWVGELDDAAKKPFLAGAAALLFPIRWEEPFGIVMAEALACGTPVVALRRGAVPEVVDHGVTGFVCDDEAGLTAAVGRLGGLDRAACRRAAETRFSADAMVEGYLSVYRELLAG